MAAEAATARSVHSSAHYVLYHMTVTESCPRSDAALRHMTMTESCPRSDASLRHMTVTESCPRSASYFRTYRKKLLSEKTMFTSGFNNFLFGKSQFGKPKHFIL